MTSVMGWATSAFKMGIFTEDNSTEVRLTDLQEKQGAKEGISG